MPKIISTSQSVAYLRALAETRNATLAAERAGVSRDRPSTGGVKIAAVTANIREHSRRRRALASDRGAFSLHIHKRGRQA